MNGRWIVPAVLLATLFAASPVAAQQYDPTEPSTNPLLNQYGAPFRQPLGRGLEDPPQPSPPLPPVTSLSPYILGATSHPDGCCGPVGCHGPVSWEIYIRNGITFSYGNPFAGDLTAGWVIQGGARTLFYDMAEQGAWVIDLGIQNICQNAGGHHTYRLIDFPEKDAQGRQQILPEKFLTGDELNRTCVGVSLGRECWLIGSPWAGRRYAPVDGEMNWRAGWDVGGRWGTQRFQPNEARHLNERLGSVFIAAHSDLEMPYGACVFQCGFRIEWSYSWNDVLQSHNPADIQDIMLLWNMGIRF
jgi:hypothetical protein